VRAPVPVCDLTEKEWQAQVLDLARLYGWRHAYHTFDSRRSASGFPDLVLVRERALFAELKSKSGKVSAAQADWLAALVAPSATSGDRATCSMSCRRCEGGEHRD
jgi:hypothetical protein